jgi:hypothetical protein
LQSITVSFVISKFETLIGLESAQIGDEIFSKARIDRVWGIIKSLSAMYISCFSLCESPTNLNTSRSRYAGFYIPVETFIIPTCEA